MNKTDILGSPKLTLAQIFVTTEKIIQVFARPLLIAGAFLVFAWLDVFTGLYPWAHLVALILFVIFFFDSLGRAQTVWTPVSTTAGRRRVEISSHLNHRPLDVLDDRPAILDEDSMSLWRLHVERNTARLQHLRWPKWLPGLAERDPYALRHALVIMLIVSAIVGWGALGGRLVAAINPALGRLHLFMPTLDAWITPPEYTGLPPIMIATPAGMRHDSDVIDIPAGSTISAHVMEHDGRAPQLNVNGDRTDFTTDDHGDFQVIQTIYGGDTLSIERGWQNIGSWRIRVVADQPPSVGFTEPPSVTERKSIRVAFKATDDYGVTSVKMRITPRESLPGASNEPIEIPLSSGSSKNIERISFQDLTSHPWSGLPVDIQLIATDDAGNTSESVIQQFVLPEREFFNPVARALIEERKKLLESPFEEGVRNTAANLMAGIAQQPASYRNDPVVLMALRSGAVRLVLDHGPDVISPVADIIWEAAIRIEDGTTGMAEQNLRAAQKDLADALEQNASEEEIGRRIDRLHQALAQYLAELSTRMAARPGPIEDLSPLTGDQTNMLTPQDLDNMLEHMRDLSATGKRDAARQELSQLQQMLENLRTGPQQLTAEQKQELQNLKLLQELVRDQKDLITKTFHDAESGNTQHNTALIIEQNALLERLKGLLPQIKPGDDAQHSADAMQDARNQLRDGQSGLAMSSQGEALKALQKAEKSAAASLNEKTLALSRESQSGEGEGQDPFGRNQGQAFNDDGTVKIPVRMQTRRVREILDELHRRASDMDRPKVERDYIDRLLQNF